MLAKPWQKKILRAVAFLLTALLAVLAAGHYLMPSSNRYLAGYTAGGILGEEYDSIEVLVMGDSNAAQGISPMQWYLDYGVTGYTYAAGWLSMYNIYYRLQEIYKEQSPAVVVLCTDPVFTKKSSETYMQSAIGDITDELLPLLRFHDNWKQITPENAFADKDYSWRDSNKGYTPITDVGPWGGGDYMYNTGSVAKIPFLVEIYMQRIVDLCRSHGSAVVLTTVPAATGWNLALHNAIAEFAQEQDLPYFDYNMPDQDPGIDWASDTPDGGTHLNVLGAQKLTDALGKVLTTQYLLTDHRGMAGYEHWDEDAAAYAELLPVITARTQENAASVAAAQAPAA